MARPGRAADGVERRLGAGRIGVVRVVDQRDAVGEPHDLHAHRRRLGRREAGGDRVEPDAERMRGGGAAERVRARCGGRASRSATGARRAADAERRKRCRRGRGRAIALAVDLAAAAELDAAAAKARRAGAPPTRRPCSPRWRRLRRAAGRRARPWRAATPAMLPRPSRCAGPTLVIDADVGRGDLGEARDLAGGVHAHLEHGDASSPVRRSSVSGRPIRLFSLPCVLRTPAGRRARRWPRPSPWSSSCRCCR